MIQFQLALFIVGLGILALGLLVTGIRHEWRACKPEEEKD